jgi:hypothetical protein
MFIFYAAALLFAIQVFFKADMDKVDSLWWFFFFKVSAALICASLLYGMIHEASKVMGG